MSDCCRDYVLIEVDIDGLTYSVRNEVKGCFRFVGGRTIGPSGKPAASNLTGIVGGVAIIGTKKLGTIRNEIEKALGDDPIQQLERQVASAKRRGDGTEVMEGLVRFLEAKPKRARRKRREPAKK